MIDIKELIALRQRNDPSFKVLPDRHTKRFYLRDRVLFMFSVDYSLSDTETQQTDGSDWPVGKQGKSLNEVAKEQVHAYVDWANQALRRRGRRPTVQVVSLTVYRNNLVSVDGPGVGMIPELLREKKRVEPYKTPQQDGTTVALAQQGGGGPIVIPPPPPPPWQLRVVPDYVNLAVVVTSVNEAQVTLVEQLDVLLTSKPAEKLDNEVGDMLAMNDGSGGGPTPIPPPPPPPWDMIA